MGNLATNRKNICCTAAKYLKSIAEIYNLTYKLCARVSVCACVAMCCLFYTKTIYYNAELKSKLKTAEKQRSSLMLQTADCLALSLSLQWF